MAGTAIITDAYRQHLRPVVEMDIPAWAAKNIVVPVGHTPGPFRAVNVPWMQQIFDDFKNPEVQYISAMVAARGSKSLTSLICLLWATDQDPAPSLWCFDSADNAEYFARQTIWPVVENCPSIMAKLPDTRAARRTLHLGFPAAPLTIVGAGGRTGGQLKSKSVRRVVLDECDLYEDHVLLAEQRNAEYWNRKTLYIGTPTKLRGVSHRNFLLGNQCVWHFPCESCGQFQELIWGAQHENNKRYAMVWDHQKDENGLTNYGLAAATVRYECRYCGHPHKDIPRTRKHICSAGKWVARNPNADKVRRSYHAPGWLPWWLEWGQIVRAWCEAMDALKYGDVTSIETWWNEKGGQPYEPDATKQAAYVVKSSAYTLQPKEKIDSEHSRFMAVDYHDHEICVWAIRAFRTDGSSKLVAAGRDSGLEKMRELQLEYGVEPRRVWMDSGFNAVSEIYPFASRYEYQCLKGEEDEYFTLRNTDGKPCRQIWKKTLANAAIGVGSRREISLFLFSKPSTLDLLDRLIHGKLMPWECGTNVPDGYLKSIHSFARVPDKTPKGWHWYTNQKCDHWLDCERMILIAAILDPKIALAKVASPATE